MVRVLRWMAACLTLLVLAAPGALASELGAANEIAARIGGKVLDVRSEGALVDASGGVRDAPAIRDALDGVTLLEPAFDDPARAADAYAVGILTRDQRLVVFDLRGAALRWSSTTLSDNLRLLPGFHNGEGPFPPDFDATGSPFNRERYGGGAPVDDLDFELRCTSAADSNGATLTCTNGYGRLVYESRCYRTLGGEVACDVDEP